MTEERAKKYRLNNKEAEKSSLGRLWCGPVRHTPYPGGPNYRNRCHSLTRMGRFLLYPAGRPTAYPGGPTLPHPVRPGSPSPAGPILPRPPDIQHPAGPQSTQAVRHPASGWASGRPTSSTRLGLSRPTEIVPCTQDRSLQASFQVSFDRTAARSDQPESSTGSLPSRISQSQAPDRCLAGVSSYGRPSREPPPSC